MTTYEYEVWVPKSKSTIPKTLAMLYENYETLDMKSIEAVNNTAFFRLLFTDKDIVVNSTLVHCTSPHLGWYLLLPGGMLQQWWFSGRG